MDRKLTLIILGALALVLACGTLVLAAGLWAGFSWFRGNAHMGYGDPGMMWNAPVWNQDEIPCVEGYGGPGMMGSNWDDASCGQGYVAPESASALSLDEAGAAVEWYVASLGYDGLHVTEVMEFERNFYAIVAEEDTGIGAMELLIDKSSGSVGPEPGPNMMWNARYGMHSGGRMGMGRMWGLASGEMALSPQEAELAAQRWLDANLPGRTAGEADAFYGYYTLHFLKDGQIDGMLSVHGSSGDVWYHSWHGGFIAMTGEHE
jgi:hypothetical protein